MNGRSEVNSPDPASISPEKQANQIRFETELEFVQCLANPHYLASLASQGLLAQPNFVAYLKYLTYWLDVDKGFARFIVYEAL
jgi:mediator of RNA polymerase II transcription subunit 31